MSSKPLAIVPCRLGSKGIRRKNVRPLAGVTPVARAVAVAHEAGCLVLLTSDAPLTAQYDWNLTVDIYVERPAGLASDSAAMVDVVAHALTHAPDGQCKVLLVQPTQPLRQAKHLQRALELLDQPHADSVVGVVRLDPTHHPDMQLEIGFDGQLRRIGGSGFRFPATRQQLKPTYLRDGTVYAFWRSTFTRYGDIYGREVLPLIIPANETCALDTPADWAEAERRLSPAP